VVAKPRLQAEIQPVQRLLGRHLGLQVRGGRVDLHESVGFALDPGKRGQWDGDPADNLIRAAQAA
jgi:hypothetical protein